MLTPAARGQPKYILKKRKKFHILVSCFTTKVIKGDIPITKMSVKKKKSGFRVQSFPGKMD
jgi:hypothetical protein